MGTTRAWGPSRGWVAAQLGLGALLLVLTPGVDAPGRLLAVPVALLVLAAGLRDLLLRPVLTAGADGLTVVSGVRREHVPWEALAAVRAVRDRRTDVLELDLGDRLLVLTARRLGAPVDEVVGELRQLS